MRFVGHVVGAQDPATVSRPASRPGSTTGTVREFVSLEWRPGHGSQRFMRRRDGSAVAGVELGGRVVSALFDENPWNPRLRPWWPEAVITARVVRALEGGWRLHRPL